MYYKNRTFIIGEAGCNHNGKIENAFRLIDIAKKTKLDAIKFQVFNPELLVTKTAKKAKYALKNTKKDESQLLIQKKISLSKEEHFKIKKYCEKNKANKKYRLNPIPQLIFTFKKEQKVPFDLTIEDISNLLKNARNICPVLWVKMKTAELGSGDIDYTPPLPLIVFIQKKVILI